MHFGFAFTETTIKIGTETCKMFFKVSNPIFDSYAAFGTIFVSETQTIAFSFFTLKNKIADFFPKDSCRDLVSDIVKCILGQTYSFDELLNSN